MKDTRLFVGNLSYNTTEDDLRDCFSQAGSVTAVNVMMDKFTGKSRGFGFVEMASAEDANKAIEMWHGKDVHDRPLTVNVARPREDRPPQGGGRDFRGGGGRAGGGGREASGRGSPRY